MDLIKSTETNTDKKVKEYGYDSLCLRYKIAREAQARYEVNNQYHGDMERSMKAAERDMIRFFQILSDLLDNPNEGIR
jgi:hypothetical protein